MKFNLWGCLPNSVYPFTILNKQIILNNQSLRNFNEIKHREKTRTETVQLKIVSEDSCYGKLLKLKAMASNYSYGDDENEDDVSKFR